MPQASEKWKLQQLIFLKGVLEAAVIRDIESLYM